MPAIADSTRCRRVVPSPCEAIQSTAAVTPASEAKPGVPCSNRSGLASLLGSSLSGRSASRTARSPTVRSVPLVRRAGVAVGAQGAHVGRYVRCRVDTVDGHESSCGKGDAGDRPDVRSGAGRVARGGHRDQAGALVDEVVVLLQRQLGGRRVDVGPPDHGAGPLGRLRPGPDVRVVVEPAQQTSSPGAHVLASAQASTYVLDVIDGPSTTPDGSPPTRLGHGLARRVGDRVRPAAAGNGPCRLLTAERITSATASLTADGTCVPPGQSKCASPSASAGKADRAACTSKVTHGSLPEPRGPHPDEAGSRS
ncbi:MAG: hypothetical protein JWN08_1044 [Frankiales bacterium]|nr:hypothetical protein [Frankiales bacterium]